MVTTPTVVHVQADAFLFDMDGVLISSIGSAVRCWRQWAAIYDLPDAANFNMPHGVPARDIIRQFRPDVDQDKALRVIEDLEMDDVGDVLVLPGVANLLRSLPLERWAIVTSCTRRLADARLQAAGLPLPRTMITADMVTRGKPAPEPYLRGAEVLSFAPGRCIVVEDAPSGVAAGVAAGCQVLGVLSSTPLDELTAATWIAASLDSVTADASAGHLHVTLPHILYSNSART